MVEKRIVRGVEIACWTNRADWRESKKCIMFIHGSGGDHTNWVYQYSRLGDGFNITVMELPGHGSSGGTGESSVPAYVQWVKETMEVFGVKKPVLVGHSLGAAISLTFAFTYGDLLSGVVPIGGGVRMPVNPAILDGLLQDPGPILEMAAKIAVAKANRERFSKLLMNGFAAVRPDVVHGDFSACNRLDITDAVASIKVPTLIICGMEDKMTPPSLSEQLRDLIPGSRLALVEGAGHFAMMEQADVFNEILGSFVKAL